MWNDKKPWWEKRRKDNQTNNSVTKNWCVIKVATSYRENLNTWELDYTYQYKAVGRSNAPVYWTAEGKAVSSAVMENLTKQEAYECAKGLNFLDGD